MQTDTLIIGGGLSGLSIAATLAQQDRDFVLVEARDRLGGRILSTTVQGQAYDLGPTWFWPGQPRIAALIRGLGLRHFDQFSDGALLYEDQTGPVQRGPAHASMQGSYRLHGGLSSLIRALANKVPADAIRLQTAVRALRKTARGVAVTCASGQTVTAQRVILTLPPRLAAELEATPAFDPSVLHALRDSPTWMAGQAKAVAVYPRRFWRDTGLSGDAMSRRGPMVEIHDASPPGDGPGALFGFIGLPPHLRSDLPALQDAVHAQFVRLFGPDAAAPITLKIKDWAQDGATTSGRDLQPLHAHPRYGLPPALSGLWDNRLIFGGTECAPQFGGYLEGALEAAENAVAVLQAERV